MNHLFRVISLFILYLAAIACSVLFILPVAGKDIPELHYEGAAPKSREEARDISVLIVPHHLVAENFIRDAFEKVSALRSRSAVARVILLGPNHFFRGQGTVITTTRSWNAEGKIAPDEYFINQIISKNLATKEQGVVEGDHAVTALVPFVAEFFPDAKFVPMLLREPMSFEEADALGDFFAQNLNEGDLVIASIDFSHYLPKFVADFHDRATIAALHNLDSEFFKYKIDADSPQILMVLAHYLRLIGHEKFTLLEHTNSATLTANPYEQLTTSHVLGFFEKGERVPMARMTIIVGPHQIGDPLIYKGADFAVDTMKSLQEPVSFQKNGLEYTLFPDDYKKTPLGIVVEKNADGEITVTRCFFETETCI